MEPTDNKKPPHQEEIELDAVDLEKIPKRVRKSKGKPAALKQKPVQPNKIFIPDEENRPRGTQKKIAPTSFREEQKTSFEKWKIPKKKSNRVFTKGFYEKGLLPEAFFKIRNAL